MEKINKLDFQMQTMQMTKLQEDQLVVIYFYLVIVLFHGNLKFKEMLLFTLLKLNLLVKLNVLNMVYG